MKLEDIPKKQPFNLPDDKNLEQMRSQVHYQIASLGEEKTAKSVSLWVKPNWRMLQAVAASLVLALAALAGAYFFNQNTNHSERAIAQVDISEIPTEKLTEYLILEGVSEEEVASLMPQASLTNLTDLDQIIISEQDLDAIDQETIDLLLEEEYL